MTHPTNTGSGSWQHIEFRVLKLPKHAAKESRVWRDPFQPENFQPTEQEKKKP